MGDRRSLIAHCKPDERSYNIGSSIPLFERVRIDEDVSIVDFECQNSLLMEKFDTQRKHLMTQLFFC